MMRILAAVLGALLSVQESGRKDVTIELSQPLKGGSGLGTAAYSATAKEAPFQARITEKRVAFRSQVKMPKPDNMTEEQWAKFLKDQQNQEDKEKGKYIPEDKYQPAE